MRVYGRSDSDSRRSRRAFTLVELLTVVGLIGLLMGLLLPALASARRGQGQFPMTAGTSLIFRADCWYNALPAMLRQPTLLDLVNPPMNPNPPVPGARPPQVGDGSLWVCPEEGGVDPSNGVYVFGYGMNMALSVTTAPQPDRITRVGPAASMVFMTDGPLGYCATLPYKPSAVNAGLFNPVARHRGKLNVAFLDGHVVCMAGEEAGCQMGDPQRADVRWYWYTPGPPPAPWGGP